MKRSFSILAILVVFSLYFSCSTLKAANDQKFPPLQIAAYNGDKDAVTLHLLKGADIDAQDHLG